MNSRISLNDLKSKANGQISGFLKAAVCAVTAIIKYEDKKNAGQQQSLMKVAFADTSGHMPAVVYGTSLFSLLQEANNGHKTIKVSICIFCLT